MVDAIKSALGVGCGGNAAYTVGGVVNHGILLPLILWFAAHVDDQVRFTASYGFLALITVCVYLSLELMRRAHPGERRRQLRRSVQVEKVTG